MQPFWGTCDAKTVTYQGNLYTDGVCKSNHFENQVFQNCLNA